MSEICPKCEGLGAYKTDEGYKDCPECLTSGVKGVKTYREAVKYIAGVDGFWKGRSEKSFLNTFDLLINQGLSEKKVFNILRDLHTASKECYGG